MVSSNAIFRRYKYIFLLVFLFIFGGAAQSFSLGFECLIGQTPCCKNGVKVCCEDNGTVYDTNCPSPSIGCVVMGSGLEVSGVAEIGTREHKYTADNECGYTTETRICCSNGRWSEWGKRCPFVVSCPESSKPETRKKCFSGYRTRSVSCDNGKWITGEWGECDCSDSGYKKLYCLDGTTCCESTSPTGLKCNQACKGYESSRWVVIGPTCHPKSSCINANIPTCDANHVGHYYERWVNKYDVTVNGANPCNGETIGYCEEILCSN